MTIRGSFFEATMFAIDGKLIPKLERCVKRHIDWIDWLKRSNATVDQVISQLEKEIHSWSIKETQAGILMI